MTVYLLLGDDEERKTRGVEKLRRNRATESFDATEASPEAVISACNSYDLFGEGPFVLLRNLDAWNAAQKAKIVTYLESSSAETDLVLLGKKLGAREKLRAAVKKAGEVHDFEQPTGKALVKWVVSNAKKQGLELPGEVAQGLTERCSGDKIRLIRETEKLALYVSDRPATIEDVEALCPPDLQSNIFAFVDSLVSGQQGRSLRLLEELLAAGEPPLRITYMIRRQFLLVAKAQALFGRGVHQGEIAKELKVPPFVVRKLEEQVHKLDQGGAERALERVLLLEGALKGAGNLGDGLQIELATLKLSG